MPLWFDIFVAGYAGLLGLVVGSFLNVCVYRIPLGISVADGRSFCPVCNHTLAVRDLVPVFSWLLLRRKCRYCQAPISARYPAVELGNAALWVLVTLRFGLQWHTALLFVFVSALLVAVLIAFDGHRVPNVIILFAAPLCILEALVQPEFLSASARVAGFFCLGIVALLLSRIKNTHGVSEVLFFAVCGAFLGWQADFIGIFFAAVSFMVCAFFRCIAKKPIGCARLTFVPYLGCGLLLSALWGSALSGWCLGLFALS